MKNTAVHIIEHDAVALELYDKFAKDNGYEAKGYRSSSEALKSLSESEPEIVVLNWDMPEMDGLDLCKEINTSKKRTKPYIIMLARKNMDSRSFSMAVGAGVNKVLVKPVDYHEFVFSLSQGVRKPRSLGRPNRKEGDLVPLAS